MKLFASATAVIAGALMSTAAFADDLVIGVSWSNFQEERWKTDEAAIKARWTPLARNTSPLMRRALLANSCLTSKA